MERRDLCPIVILGATATGKSDLAVELASTLSGEVVNFDSACLYRRLDVGTAKPTAEARARVPHHLLDVAEPTELVSAGRFVELADAALASVRARGRVAILAGGTGLYLRALLRGLVASPPPDPVLRRNLQEREQRSPGALWRIASRLDPAGARTLRPADTLRLVRLIEHRLATGQRLSVARSQWRGPERFPTRKLGLALGRDQRDARVRARVERMLEAGFVEEVRGLLDSGVSVADPGMRALGYRDVAEHLAGTLDRENLVSRIVLSTRRYARRQDTWFRGEPGVTWLDAGAGLPDLLEAAMLALRPG